MHKLRNESRTLNGTLAVVFILQRDCDGGSAPIQIEKQSEETSVSECSPDDRMQLSGIKVMQKGGE